MPAELRPGAFWWRWVVANSVAELLGLGTAAAVGFLLVARLGEPHGLRHALAVDAAFIVLGAFEGLVVGVAQERVLRPQLPELRGWVRATVIGASVAWALGMAPSTIMSVATSDTSAPPPNISEPVRLLLAAALGAVAGPVLAFFQWRRLRQCVPRLAAWWLPANALAWAVGMPVVVLGAHVSAFAASTAVIVLGVALSLLAAGAVVGAIHGRVLLWLLSPRPQRGSAA